MKRFKYLTLAALVAFAACDEGEGPVVAPPVTGTISGVVTIEGTAASGVSVELSSGTTATTDASGSYTFTDVSAGSYTVSISGVPSDATFSSTTKGATIASAGQVVTVNFDGSYVRTSAIQGSVNAGGNALQGVTVSIGGGLTTTTDVNGTYGFSGLRAGDYTVSISGFDANKYTFAETSQTVTIAAGEAKLVPFSGQLVTTASISGSLFLDEDNKDDQFTAGIEDKLAVANVAVTIEGGSVAVFDTVQTDANGDFSFGDLAEGTYRVGIITSDPQIPNNVAFGGTSDEALASVTAGSSTAVNWPFDIIVQGINVYAFLGTDADVSLNPGPGVTPLAGMIVDLYDTQANAASGGSTGRLGRDTTDVSGETQFSFMRSADVSPNSSESDQVVFARRVGVIPPNHSVNGEAIIEIRYNAKDSLGIAPDTLDALNNTIVFGFDAREIDGDTLATWSTAFRNSRDSASTTLAGSASTNQSGRVLYTLNGPANTFPDTLWLRLADQQPNANGHGWGQTPDMDEGTASGRSLRYIWKGTTAASDTIILGTQNVKYTDSNIQLRVHHEADDSTSTPVFTGGDNFTAAPNVRVQLKNTAGTVIAGPVSAAAGTGIVTFPFTAVATYGAEALSSSPTIDVLNSREITVELDGSDQVYVDSTLAGNAGASTYAYKFNTNTVNGSAKAADGTAAAGITVKLMATPNNIQPNRGKDTTLTTTAAGTYSVTGLRDGPYSAMALDSVTAGGDSIWAFLGTDTDTVDVVGPSDTGTLTFLATRMDTKIQGVVVNDRDVDYNTIDPDEALSGVTVDLYADTDNDGTIDAGEPLMATTQTDGNGAYEFTGLREGYYLVQAQNTANATVLRALSATGAVTNTAQAVTAAAVGTNNFKGQNFTRTVGTKSPPAQGDELPRWGYTQGQAPIDGCNLNTAAVPAPNCVNGNRTTNPTHFIHLFSTGTVTGKVLEQAAPNDPAVGVRVTITRCQTSGSAPSPPTQGACTTKHGSPSPHIQNVDTDATGTYTFNGLLEGVYVIDVAPATGGYTTITTPGSNPRSYLATLVGNNDVETAPDFQVN